MLESLFRKRFFVVHLALSALLAILLARTVTGIAARVLVEKLSTMQAAAPTKAPLPRTTGALRDFEAAKNANIFEGKREVPVPLDDPNAGKSVDVDVTHWWDAPKSALRLRLVGTVAFSDPAYSLASIIDESKGGSSAEVHSIQECQNIDTSRMDPEDAKLVGKPAPCKNVGDVATVLRIEPEKVYIQNLAESRVEYLALNEPPADGAPPPVAAKVEKTDGGDSKEVGEGIVKTGENAYGVPRAAVEGALNNLSELATQARIVPAFESGKPVGFKLFSIKPGSLYSKIGLQNGDVINRINGYEMTSPEKGLEVYQKLKDSSNITVDIKRRGKAQTLDYTIQ